MKWKIGWGLSNLCNMKCSFCYSKKVRQEPDYEFNIQKGLEFVLRNKDRIDSINFGTGEPTLCPEMFMICDRIKKEAPEISIGITTNGTLAEAVKDPAKMDIFERCVDDVDVSMDYGDKENQDRSRGFPGAYERALRTLGLCKIKNKNVTVVNALHKDNCFTENLDALVRIARIFGASFRVNIYRPTVNFDLALSYDDMKKAFLHLVRNYGIESVADPLIASLIGVPCPDGDPVGKSSFRILPNGFITPSTYLIDKEWQSIRIDEIDNIDSLHDYEQFKRITNQKIPEMCRDCIHRTDCRGGVIDRRWLWNKSLGKKDPYCPYENGDDSDWKEECGTIMLPKIKKSFVHDGYLTTLIFSSDINPQALTVWDRIYSNLDNDYQDTRPAEIAVRLNEYLPCGAKIADLGSGLGRNGLYLLGHGKEVIFIDNSKTACDAVLKSCLEKKVFSGYHIKDVSIEEYLKKEQSSSLDGILASHVISHGTPKEISEIIGNIFRVLKKEAFFAVTLPSAEDLRLKKQVQKNGPVSEKDNTFFFALEEGPEKGIVHSFYTESALRKLFEKFSILDFEEKKDAKGNAHWNIIIQK